MSKMRQYSFTGIKEVGFTISRDEKAALEMYFRLCRTGTDRDTAFEKVSAHFGAKLASEAIPWKR